MPGHEIKLIPNEDKLEIRMRGPNITTGYYKQDDLTQKAFDEENFFCIGDAGKFEDEDDPSKGIVFDGRVAENFKLLWGHETYWAPSTAGDCRCISSDPGCSRNRARPGGCRIAYFQVLRGLNRSQAGMRA